MRQSIRVHGVRTPPERGGGRKRRGWKDGKLREGRKGTLPDFTWIHATAGKTWKNDDRCSWKVMENPSVLRVDPGLSCILYACVNVLNITAKL